MLSLWSPEPISDSVSTILDDTFLTPEPISDNIPTHHDDNLLQVSLTTHLKWIILFIKMFCLLLSFPILLV